MLGRMIWCFRESEGEQLDPSALHRRFARARDKAGLPKLRFHDLRHSFGSLCAQAGVPVVQIQSWMGHSSITTTQIYLHVTSRASDADLLDAAFAA